MGQITFVLPGIDLTKIPDTVKMSLTAVGDIFKNTDPRPFTLLAGTKTGNSEFGYLMFRYFGRGLQEGYFKGHPYEVAAGGFGGVKRGLRALKEGRASAVKCVFRIGETKGVMS